MTRAYRAQPGCLAAVIAAVLIAWPGEGRAQETGPARFIVLDSAYTGKLKDDPVLRAFTDSFPAICDSALAIIADRLGTPPAAGDTLRVIIEDMPLSSTGKTYRSGSYAHRLSILLFAENIKTFPREYLIRVLAHELIHGLLHRAGKDREHEVALWANEGIATYGAGMGPLRLDNTLCTIDAPPGSLLDDLAFAEDECRWQDYAAYSLFFETVARNYGDRTPASVFQRLLAGDGCEDALRACTGTTWSKLRPAILADARRWLSAYAERDYRRLLQAREKQRLHRYGEAIASYRAVLAGPYRELGRYETGNCYRDSGLFDSAAAFYQCVYDSGGLLDGKALYRLAMCHVRLSNNAKAASLLEIYRTGFPGGSDMDNVFYFLGQQYYNSRQYQLAAQRWETFLLNPQYATADAAANVTYQLGCCYYALDNNDMARIWIMAYLRKYPGHNKRAKAEQLLAHIEDSKQR